MPASLRAAAAALIVGILILAGQAANAPTRVVVQVLTPEGAKIASAVVLFHPDDSGKNGRDSRLDVWAKSNREGAATAELQPGFYDLVVMKGGFTAVTRKIVLEGKDPMVLVANLSFDPLVLCHLGDTFH